MIEPTIFAKASGSGRAAVAVIRISGRAAADALRRLCGTLPSPRTATLRRLRDPRSGESLDQALVIWFPAPRSFTGEDVAELQIHGGRAVSDALLRALAGLDGLRPAEPGEFTRRAFLNGRMSLPEVEGLADLIDADTDAQRRQALRQLDGVLGRWAEALRNDLAEALALAEACIDFADEDDLAAGFGAELRARESAALSTIEAELRAAPQGERLREGVVVAIAGPPNVGKSTLLNRLAGRDVAIVSAYAGTTRDAIEVDLDLGGHPVRMIDTAGLRDTDDPIEQQGIVRARARAAQADLVLWLDDGGGVGAEPPFSGRVWRVATKADAVTPAPNADHVLSALTGAGIDALVTAIAAQAESLLSGSETALVTRLRHRQALEAASALLARSAARSEPELIAEDLRGALKVLGTLVGDVATEDVLGLIFARFCIGK